MKLFYQTSLSVLLIGTLALPSVARQLPDFGFDGIETVNVNSASENGTYEYKGYLDISLEIMLGVSSPLAEKLPATIQITPDNNGKCRFVLPNFNLESMNLNLGDIVVDNVSITKKDGADYYEGSVENMKIRPVGATSDIIADVALSGTIEKMDISVVWIVPNEDNPTAEPGRLPIQVVFTKAEDDSGIADITADDANAPVEFFNLQGVRVNADNLVPGIYVRRQGSKTSKVLVK